MPYRRFLLSQLVLFVALFPLFSHPALADHGQDNTIIITTSKAWKPFSYLQHDKPKGLLIDFWRLYGERTNTKIVFDLVDWQESLDKTAVGDAQIHAGLVFSKSRAKHFEFGSELFNLQTSVYVDVDMLGMVNDDLSNLKQPVGVVIGGYAQEFIALHYPDIPLMSYANNELMFAAVRRQEISVFIADKQVANFYMLSFLNRPNGFIALTELYDEPIRFAVRKGNVALLAVIEEGLSSFNQSDIDQIRQKWINTETQVPNWFYNSVILTLMFLAMAYICTLRRAVDKRTRQLETVNEKLTEQVNSDVLTGLYNRRYLMEYLHDMHHQRDKSNFALLMIDIDFFKPINDTHGHPVGDIVLTILAKRVQSCIRTKDILARIGGEEFCVLLEGVSEHKMQLISHNINKNVASHQFKHRDKKLSVTVSIGALYVNNQQDWSSEALLQQVDKLLYEAKDNGRDQTVCGQFS